MEHIAGRAEMLAKEKAKDPTPPFRERKTESIYSKVYSSEGKVARNKGAKQREIRQTRISKLGEVEYKRLLREVDLMTKEQIDIDKIINKRLKEIEERLQAEEKEKENQDCRQTRSQAGTSSEEPKEGAQKRPKTAGKQPKTDDGQTAGKRPKTAGKQLKTAGKKPKTGDKTAGKQPKTAEKKPKTGDQDEKSIETPRNTKGAKKPKTTKTPQHVNDEEFDLDLDTGKFIRRKNTGKTADDNDDINESRRRPQVAKKSAPVPLLEDDDDVEDDLEIIDDQDKDKDYQPDNDDYNDEEDNVVMPQDEDDDDFEIPPLRTRKPVKDEQVKMAKKKHQTSSTKRRVGESKPEGEDINDETLNLFQKIVGSEFEVKASQ